MVSNKTKIEQKTPAGAYPALLLATLLLTANFWAWSLISPLATKYADELALEPFVVSALISGPVILGALGRIVLGSLTDRYGARKTFAVTCLVASLPVFWLAMADSSNELFAGVLLLGISGATFAIGVPFVSAWFPPNKRGLALGIYGIGDLGVAVSGFLTPQLDHYLGRQWLFITMGFLLAGFGLIANRYLRDAPAWKPIKASAISRLREASAIRTTWDLSLMYTLTFGAFVATGVYLPVLLVNTYDLTVSDAAARAAGFIIIATLARPLGGWLSDRLGGDKVLRLVLLTTTALAVCVALPLPLVPLASAGYLLLAFVLGCGSGAVFSLLSKLSPPKLLGTIGGIVGAAGGLGGFFPPLVMGASLQLTGSYAVALLLLAATAGLLYRYAKHHVHRPLGIGAS